MRHDRPLSIGRFGWRTSPAILRHVTSPRERFVVAGYSLPRGKCEIWNSSYEIVTDRVEEAQ